MPYKYNSFICANSEQGFMFLKSPVAEREKVYVIKGGPGTGKSTFMRRISEKLFKNGYNVENILCSSDPYSLDGVICGNISIFDGTLPHTLEPPYPGAVGEIINLCEFWHADKIRDRKEEIINLNEKMSKAYKSAYDLLHCAGKVFKVKDDIVQRYTLMGKIERLAQTFVKNKTGGIKKGIRKSPEERFCRAVNFEGIFEDKSAETALCKEFYAVKDKYFTLGPEFIKAVSSLFSDMGYAVIEFKNPIQVYKTEKIIVPQLSLCVSAISDTKTPYRCINAERFSDKESLKSRKEKISFYIEIGNELLEDSFAKFKAAKELHDELEKIYIPAMDFERMKQFCSKTGDMILRSIENESKEEKAS